MAPSLRIPVSLDLDALAQQGQQASDHMGTVLRQIGKRFADLNGELLGVAKDTAAGVALAWGQTAVGTVVELATIGAAGYAAFKLIESAVGEAKREIADMVDLAEKAQAVNLSPSAFQAFTAAAKGSQDELGTLESALQTFFTNAKDVLDKSVSPDALEEQKVKWSDLATAVRTYAFDLNLQGPGADTFVKATGTDAEVTTQRLLGVVEMLKEMYDAGYRLEALDLAGKAFGSNFADGIRQGKINLDDVADTVQNRLVKGIQDANAYNDKLVQRAKDLNDELDTAWHTISRNLQPTWETLDEAALDIKNIWVDIVGLLEKASAVVPWWSGGSPSGDPKAELADVSKQITDIQARLAPGGATMLDTLLDRAPVLAVQLAKLQERAAQLQAQIGGGAAPAGVPVPQPRPTNIPQPSPSSGGDDVSAFDRTTDAINRHIASLNADAAAVGANKTQLEALRAEMQLLQAIQRDDGEVTQDQVDKYAQLRATMGAQQALTAAGITLNAEHAQSFADISTRVTDASARLEQAKNSFQGVNDAVRFFGNETASALSNITAQTKGIDLLRTAVGDLTKELINAAITGQGAFAKILGLAPSSSGGVGGLFGAIAGLLSFDSGGYTGDGGKNDPAGIVHKGEVVWSQDDVRRAGGAAVVDAMRRNGVFRGYADGGIVMPAPAVAASPVPAAIMRQAPAAPATIVEQKIDNYFSSGITGADRTWIAQQVAQSAANTRALARQDAKNQSARRSG